MRHLLAGLLLVSLSAPLVAQDSERTERVQFARGTSSKTITASIKGYDAVAYLVGARAGQTLTVSLKTSSGSNYFNVTAPGADAAMFVGSTSGNSYTTKIPSSGDYKIQVYLMRNAARRGESARFTLTVGVR